MQRRGRSVPPEGEPEVTPTWRTGGACANGWPDLRAPVVSYCFGVNGSALEAPARFRAMGTDVEVLAVGADATAMTELGERAANALEAREARWSRFRPTSELCRLNDAGGAPVMVSSDTFTLIARAVEAWRATGGRYDPTVLAALEAAGYDRDFDAVARTGAPVPERAPDVPGCEGVELDELVSAVRLPPGIALDLGGIGKGFAADAVSTELLDAGVRGVRGVLVNLGGDLRARGEAPPPHGWVVAVDDPLATARTGLLALGEGAVATSTRTRRMWTRGDRTLHHLIDPRSGQPARSGLASVTVVAAEAWRAEVLAKAAFVAGVDDGARLVTDAGATGLFVTDDGDVVELTGLAAFRP
jgi:thiamine biosynthesis lipoprotein